MKKVMTITAIVALAISARAEWFGGSGDQATSKFKLYDGIYVFSPDYNGSGYFGAWLLDEGGNKIELLANTTLRGKTSKAVGVRTGYYMINADADGSWSIDVRKADLWSSRRSFEGKLSQATALFELQDGGYKFKMKHSGRSNFQVEILDAVGRHVDTVANEIGPVDASQIVRLEAGKYILNVTADGDWSIDIGSP